MIKQVIGERVLPAYDTVHVRRCQPGRDMDQLHDRPHERGGRLIAQVAPPKAGCDSEHILVV